MEQITTENRTSDEPSTPPGPCVQQQASTDASASTMVGPTTAELESLNELIRFDHVYYKVTSPAGLVVTSSSQQVPAGAAIVSVVQQKQQQSNSNQRPVKSKQGEQATFTSKPQVVDTVNASVPTVQILDNFDQGISQEGLDRLLDLDSILQDDLTQTVDVSPTTMMASPNSTAQSTNNTAQVGCDAVSKDSLSIPTTTGLQSRKRKLSNINTDLNIPYSLSLRNQRLESDDILGLEQFSPLDDSNYSSDLSNAGSPRSEASSLLDGDWEESFTELFPSLVYS